MKKNALRFLAELAVVFIGVYLAFTLSNFNQANVEKRNRITFYKNFVSEFKKISQFANYLQTQVDQFTTNFEDSISQGFTPELKVHTEWDFTLNLFITKAVFNQNHFTDGVKRNYLVNIDMGTNYITLIENEIKNYKSNCRQLLYFQKYKKERFYNKYGKLYPEYQWYINDAKRIGKLLGGLAKAIDEGAIPDTEKLIKKEES